MKRLAEDTYNILLGSLIFFLFFPENWLWCFMQIISLGDSLHEILKPNFFEK